MTMSTGTKNIRSSVNEFGRFMACDGATCRPGAKLPPFHYRLGAETRQPFRTYDGMLAGESVSVPRRNEHSWGIPEVNILRCEQRLAGNIGAGGRLLQDCANMAEVKS